MIITAAQTVLHLPDHESVRTSYEFSREMHKNQFRKYTGEPYIVHPVAVAQLVYATVENVNMVCAALLHDVLEDTPATPEFLMLNGINPAIVDLVIELTDTSKLTDGNRATRKALDRIRLSTATAAAQTIKVADLIDNSRSIFAYDPNFAKVFAQEMELLLNNLKRADPTLRKTAYGILRQYKMGITIRGRNHETHKGKTNQD